MVIFFSLSTLVTLRAQYCLATMLRLMYQVSRQIADSQKYRATSFNACGHLAIKISRGEVPDHVQKPAAALVHKSCVVVQRLCNQSRAVLHDCGDRGTLQPWMVTTCHATFDLSCAPSCCHITVARPVVRLYDYCCNYTVSQKNYTPWCLIITVETVDRFSKFFHQLIHRKILYVYTTKISSPHCTKCNSLPTN